MATIRDLMYLVGMWEGTGVAEYPTISQYNYREEFILASDAKNPVLHFQQRAWIVSTDTRNNEPISWESGFLIDRGDSLFELICAHVSGRMEWYRGVAGLQGAEGIRLPLENVSIVNENRLLRSARIFHFGKDSISYEQLMTTTRVTQHLRHLTAELHRAG